MPKNRKRVKGWNKSLSVVTKSKLGGRKSSKSALHLTDEELLSWNGRARDKNKIANEIARRMVVKCQNMK